MNVDNAVLDIMEINVLPAKAKTSIVMHLAIAIKMDSTYHALIVNQDIGELDAISNALLQVETVQLMEMFVIKQMVKILIVLIANKDFGMIIAQLTVCLQPKIVLIIYKQFIVITPLELHHVKLATIIILEFFAKINVK